MKLTIKQTIIGGAVSGIAAVATSLLLILIGPTGGAFDPVVTALTPIGAMFGSLGAIACLLLLLWNPPFINPDERI